MDNALRQAIEAPQLAPGRRGLIAAAVEITPPDDRWIAGFAFGPESCEPAQTLPITCGPGDVKAAGANPEIIEYDPFLVIGSDKCSVAMGAERDREGRARRQLLATESHQVEAELWDGALARAEGYANPFLADSTTVDLGTAGATRALATLEQELAECLHGQRGMIHATPYTVSVWQALGLLRVDSGLLLTALDTIVVSGSGYSGSAPGAGPGDDPIEPADLYAAANAYGTGLVYVRRGRITPVGDDVSRVNRSINDITVFVERPVAATWAGCCALTIEVDHTTSGVDTPA